MSAMDARTTGDIRNVGELREGSGGSGHDHIRRQFRQDSDRSLETREAENPPDHAENFLAALARRCGCGERGHRPQGDIVLRRTQREHSSGESSTDTYPPPRGASQSTEQSTEPSTGQGVGWIYDNTIYDEPTSNYDNPPGLNTNPVAGPSFRGKEYYAERIGEEIRTDLDKQAINILAIERSCDLTFIDFAKQQSAKMKQNHPDQYHYLQIVISELKSKLESETSNELKAEIEKKAKGYIEKAMRLKEAAEKSGGPGRRKRTIRFEEEVSERPVAHKSSTWPDPLQQSHSRPMSILRRESTVSSPGKEKVVEGSDTPRSQTWPKLPRRGFPAIESVLEGADQPQHNEES